MLPASKLVLAVDGLTASAAGTQVIGYVDRLGYDFVSLDVKIEAAATNAPTVLKLGDAAVTNVTSATDIVALTGGTATSSTVGFVIPALGTSAGNIMKLNCDCRGSEALPALRDGSGRRQRDRERHGEPVPARQGAGQHNRGWRDPRGQRLTTKKPRCCRNRRRW